MSSAGISWDPKSRRVWVWELKKSQKDFTTAAPLFEKQSTSRGRCQHLPARPALASQQGHLEGKRGSACAWNQRLHTFTFQAL